MKIQVRKIVQSLGVIFLALVLISASGQRNPNELAPHSYLINDLFAAVNSGRVFWFDGSGPNQVFHDTLNTTRGGFTTGMTLDADYNLYVTNFSDSSISKLDNKGALVAGQWAVTRTAQPECIVWDRNGDFYVTSATPGGLVHKFRPDGTLIRTYDFNPYNVGRGGTDWMDLAEDNCTMYWTVEDDYVRTYDVCADTGPSPFSVALPYPQSFAVRILPNGQVLVADFLSVVLLNADGTVDTTYDVTGENSWFSLVLVEGCQEFWAGNTATGRAYRFDIATGTGMDNHLEMLDTGVGNNNLYGLTIVGECLAAHQPDFMIVDIKPRSCPNPLNTKSNGVLPVAILGTAGFDVAAVDPATILLEGVAPIRWAFEDVAAPLRGEPCECWSEGPDGFQDLTIKFDKQEIVQALGEVSDGDTSELALTWDLYDGSSMEGSDCVRILKKPASKARSATLDGIQAADLEPHAPRALALFQNSPNPFRDETRIRFSLPERTLVTLTIHDVMGRSIATLIEDELPAGTHTAELNADMPSGMYFYRLKAGDFTDMKKMILLH